MASTYEYIISLQDKASVTMRTIVGASSQTVTKLTALSEKSKVLQAVTADLGNNIFNLKQKIDLLQQEKEFIDPSNLDMIKRYNREIGELEKQIDKLDNAGKGGKLKGYFGEIGGMVKGIFNPVTLGVAAIGFAGKSAMNFDEDMAKVNITAQLDEKGLGELKNKLKKIAKENKTDVTVVPTGFEKIISQTGDVDASLQILDASLKGSKAGFTELDTVTGALAQTLSIVGTKNSSAQEVLDTFFAAKRVGAGEFKDFASYMPGLIAGADSLGINYKSVAGVFAYMTGKGQDAARASVLMSNMYSVLGKTDITQNLGKAGVKIFDAQGKMRGMVDIFKELGGVMAGMSDEQKSGFLEKIGIVDKEAKNAFAIMGSDIEKLSSAMQDTANATGETAKAMEFSKNPIQKATELWNSFKGLGLEIGTLVLPIISVGLDVLGGILSGLSLVVSGMISFFSGWFGLLQDGNPLVFGLTAAIIALTGCYVAYNSAIIASTISSKAKTIWDGITAGTTAVMTAAQWAYNTSLYACPIVWIVAGIAALVASLVWAWNTFEGFRKVVCGVWETIKEFGKMLWDSLVSVIRNVIEGIGALGTAIGKFFSGDFTEAAAAAKEGVAKLWNANPIVATVKTAVNTDFAGAWKEGTQKGADSWAKSHSEKADKATLQNRPEMIMPGMPEVPVIQEEKTGTGNYDDLMKKMGGKKEKTNPTKEVLNLNEPQQEYKGTASYSAIAAKLSPVKMPIGKEGVAPTSIPEIIAPDVAVNVPTVVAENKVLQATMPTMDKVDYGKDKTDWLKQIAENVQKIAAVVAIPIAVAIPTLQTPTPASSPDGVQSEYNVTQVTNTSSRPMMERFCDSLNINIQSADNKGYEQIRQEITSVLEQLIDDYEA